MTERKKSAPTGSNVGDDLVEAFGEMAAHLSGEETGAEVYEARFFKDRFTTVRIKAIRKTVARSTKAFEETFGVPARTMEAYESGRRRPDGAMTALLRIIEAEPEAAKRAVEH